MVDGKELKDLVEGQNKENEDTKRRTSTLWTKDTRQVTLDDFVILKVLGAGAFGTVLLVNK